MRWSHPLSCAATVAGLMLIPSSVAAGLAPPARSLTKMDYGKTHEGEAVELYVLKNGSTTVKVMTYGAIVTDIDVPDRDGQVGGVVLGFDDLKGYLGKHPHFGATIGRVANRIGGAGFTLDGKDYKLAANNGPNTLHGGLKGFDKFVWKASDTSGPDGPAVTMTHRSPDGDEGFPGNLDVSVTFTVTADNALKIDYKATTDAPTPVNLTNHSYFNLAGPASGPVYDQTAMIAADRYTPVSDALLPTGELAPVAGTPLDFTKPTPIGARIKEIKGDPVGYDHNYVLRGGDGKSPHLAARMHDPKTGRTMEVLTTEPGIQLYTGNFLDGSVVGKGGVAYRQHQSFCLEAQHFPDAVHRPGFPSIILRPGETYTQTTIYRFSVTPSGGSD